MKKILVIHGPNLNLLGEREVNIYGAATLEDINAILKKQADAAGVALEVVQSNHEGEIVDMLQKTDADAVVLNPGGYTHYSIAIRDAVAAIKTPVVETHLSNIYGREDFRRESVIAPVAAGQVSGFGAQSYELSLAAAIRLAGKPA
jgi:3-dehydroquinate dehydratase-2